MGCMGSIEERSMAKAVYTVSKEHPASMRRIEQREVFGDWKVVDVVDVPSKRKRLGNCASEETFAIKSHESLNKDVFDWDIIM